jgi:PncC family amidohydrolase
VFFFEKKNQKTFIPFISRRSVILLTCGHQRDKSFLLLFFKKEALILLSQHPQEGAMRTLLDPANHLAAALRARGETVAVVESSAGGLIAAALLAQPGASAYFLGGAVVYTAPARQALLGITAADMAGMRSSSEPYALLLARRVRERLGATWGLAETGAAGPAGNRYGDAPGHTCLAISGPVEASRTLETGSADRVDNMRAFAAAALALLQAQLASAPPGD